MIAASIALVLSGCGSDGSGSGLPASPDEDEILDTVPGACDLLTVEEIDAATKRVAQEGKYNDELVTDTQSVCEWVTEPKGKKNKNNNKNNQTSPEDLAFVQVVVNLTDYPAARDEAREVLGKAPVLELDGAEKAYLGGDGTVVGMQVGGYFAQVTNIPLNKKAVKQLANDVGYRLQGEDPPGEDDSSDDADADSESSDDSDESDDS